MYRRGVYVLLVCCASLSLSSLSMFDKFPIVYLVIKTTIIQDERTNVNYVTNLTSGRGGRVQVSG